jgi:Tol biopolymer transport system component
VLAGQPSNTDPAPQPNGTVIAYDLGDTAWLYHIDTDESELFDVSSYGLEIRKGLKIGSPSWSPDGKKLAWWVWGTFSPPLGGSVALAVFDLGAGSVELLHPYTPVGSGGWLPAAIWSPDGNWLAALTLSEAHKTDLWVVRVDGGEERNLGFAGDPVWHPEGGSLIFNSLLDDSLKMVEVGDWNLQTVDLPPGSTPLGWQGIIRDFSVANQQSADAGPFLGPEIYFTTDPEKADSQSVFPYGTPEIFAIWSYHNMREGLTVRGEWYLDGGVLMAEEELLDITRYGIEGFIMNFSIYDFERGLEPGRYQLRLYIDGREQALGQGEDFLSAVFDITAPIDIPPQVSPDLSRTAIVEPPGILIIQDVASQDRMALLTVAEISSLAWYPDGKFILFSVRDCTGQQSGYEPFGFIDQLWVVNLESGNSYPFQDQFGQATGFNLHDPSISIDGLYLAAIEGTGWVDACQVARKLWIKEIGVSGDRLYEVYSYYQLDFAVTPTSENGEMYASGSLDGTRRPS